MLISTPLFTDPQHLSRDGSYFMNIKFTFKSVVMIVFSLVFLFTNTGFSAPNQRYNNKAIDSNTQGKVSEIQKHLKKIKAKRTTDFRTKLVRSIKARKKLIKRTNKLKVTATAYTSHVKQTDSTPNIAAWGDKLRPGMKVIAVSRDLLQVYGLKHGTRVRIKGLSGEYRVLDKMNKRWRKKIDIYMGKDLRKAFKWGRRKVELQWRS